MMLEHFGHADAADAIVRAIEEVLRRRPRTRDIGGSHDAGGRKSDREGGLGPAKSRHGRACPGHPRLCG